MAEEGRAYFLDTSALVKLYHEERGSKEVERLAADLTVPLVVSEIARVEFHSAFARKVREGHLTDAAFQEVLACFREDLDHRYQVVPVGAATFETAIGLLIEHGTTAPLRTLDALQIASAKAVETSELTFVTADTKVVTVASQVFGRVLNPEQVDVPVGSG